MYFQITELQRARVQSFSLFFTEETQVLYNWSGKGKKPIRTNEVFLLVQSKSLVHDSRNRLYYCTPPFNLFQSFWFNNDSDLMKLKVQTHWERLSQKRIKKRNRANVAKQLVCLEEGEQGQHDNDEGSSEEVVGDLDEDQ